MKPSFPVHFVASSIYRIMLFKHFTSDNNLNQALTSALDDVLATTGNIEASVLTDATLKGLRVWYGDSLDEAQADELMMAAAEHNEVSPAAVTAVMQLATSFDLLGLSHSEEDKADMSEYVYSQLRLYSEALSVASPSSYNSFKVLREFLPNVELELDEAEWLMTDPIQIPSQASFMYEIEGATVNGYVDYHAGSEHDSLEIVQELEVNDLYICVEKNALMESVYVSRGHGETAAPVRYLAEQDGTRLMKLIVYAKDDSDAQSESANIEFAIERDLTAGDSSPSVFKRLELQ